MYAVRNRRYDGLSFVKVDAEGKPKLWAVTSTGDIYEDNRLGRRYAEELAVWIRSTGSATIMPYLIEALASKDKFGPIERSFLLGIGILLEG